jgi:hypothetical protein
VPLLGERLRSGNQGVRLDPNTHAFVMATAVLTSISFVVFAMNLLAVFLSHVLQ